MSRREALFMAATAVAALAAGCNSAAQTPPTPVSVEDQALSAEVPETGGMMGQVRESCPMLVAGATVEVSDVAGGAGMTFTTRSGDVASLRARVRRMADRYGMHTGHGGMMWHQMAGGGHSTMGAGHEPDAAMMGAGRGVDADLMGAGHGPGAGMMGAGHGPGAGMMGGPGAAGAPGMPMIHGMMPAATATVEEVDGGARIVLMPTDPSQIEALRDHVRMHHERMQSGACPMLQTEP